MARLIPDDWKSLAATGAAERERETLAALEHALPDTYTVYHGVHWTRADQGFSVFGEAAFVVVSAAGRVLLIEQKAGFLRETPKASSRSTCRRSATSRSSSRARRKRCTGG